MNVGVKDADDYVEQRHETKPTMALAMMRTPCHWLSVSCAGE